MKTPLPYSPSIEHCEKNEAQTVEGLKHTLHDILDTTSKDYSRVVREVHAKSCAILSARLQVLANLPPEDARGLFVAPATHAALIRISIPPGDDLPDSVLQPRGLALKILDVEGAWLAGAEGATTLDFIFVNGPAFTAPTASKFFGSLKMLAATTDKAERAKSALSAILRGDKATPEAVGGESATLKVLGGVANLHPFDETYFSQIPLRFDLYIAKFSMLPVSNMLTRHTNEIIDVHGRRNVIREQIAGGMQQGIAEWEVQLLRDADKMPIEDSSKPWPEDDSEFMTVARRTAEPPLGWSDDRAELVDDSMRFTVWIGLAAHQPLGSINRVRKHAYDVAAEFRAEYNGCLFHEPRTADLPRH